MNTRAFDLVAVSALAALDMTVTLMVPEAGTARMLLALPLVLFLPGYALTAAVFPTQRTGAAERLLFSLGLSLAVAVFGGLLLQWTSLGLRPEAWAVVLGNATLMACLVALMRRWRRPAESPSPPTPLSHVGRGGATTPLPHEWAKGLGDGGPATRRGAGLRLAHGVQLGLAAVLVGTALVVSRDGASQQAGGFTQLWMLPAGDASQDTMRLGITNRELEEVRYRVLVTSNGTTVGSWPLIRLGPNEQWESTVALAAAQPHAETVEALLYRLDAPDTLYRRVVVRLAGQGGGG
jgi:uncharacterized membrane protein